MNKGLIRLTLVLGLAATLGACAGETAPTATPSAGGETPPASAPAPKEPTKTPPGAEKSPGAKESPAAKESAPSGAPSASPKKP